MALTKLQKMLCDKWDFIYMQAQEQVRYAVAFYVYYDCKLVFPELLDSFYFIFLNVICVLGLKEMIKYGSCSFS